jgi:hypothetical protein
MMCSLWLGILCPMPGQTAIDSFLHTGTDLSDVFRAVFGKAIAPDKAARPSAVSILPSMSYNPSMDFVFGTKGAIGRQLGSSDNTEYSVASFEALYSTRKFIILQLRHNIFTPGNAWNLQGHAVLSRFGISDYGTGSSGVLGGDCGGATPNRSESCIYTVNYLYTKLSQRIYRQLGHNLYAGGGLSFDMRTDIRDERLDSTGSTPHYLYSVQQGYNPGRYNANGLLLNVQYNDREHTLRSMEGFYADLGLRLNQTWLGSSRNALQLVYDMRYYLPLSDRRPDHVLAIWHWGSVLMGGSLPYLEMPGTGTDIYSRSGRGYTIGYFRGPTYVCLESEYRFPITRNQFLGGVLFANVQSATSAREPFVFETLEPAGGAGLRILVNKESRSTVCLDYGFGRFGSRGLFIGLNEVF